MLTGVRTFSCHACALDYIVDMANSLDDNVAQQLATYPLSFSELMDELSMLNLVTP